MEATPIKESARTARNEGKDPSSKSALSMGSEPLAEAYEEDTMSHWAVAVTLAAFLPKA